MTRHLPFAVAAFALIAASRGPGSWSSGPSLPVARSEVAVAALGDDIYVIGGYANGDVDQDLVEVLKARSKTWRAVAPLPRGLNHVGAVGYHGKIYAFGGFSAQNNSAVADAGVYDPASNAWSTIARLPRPLGSVSAAVLANEIDLVGGRDTRSTRTHLVYDPATNSWLEYAPLPQGRHGTGAVVVNGRLYVPAGAFVPGGSLQSNTLLVFTL
jgi:N-acetylneuraminic acid mutarotase